MTNEVRNVQDLRFPEFEGAWENKKLDDLGDYSKSYSFSRAVEGKGYIHHIHYGDIHSKLPSKIDNINSLPTITENKDFNYLQKGDIVFADASEDYKDLGKAVLFDSNSQNVIAGLHTHVFRVNNQIVSEFLINYTKTLRYYKFIKRQGTGISVLGISKKNLSNFNLGLPEYNEQKKIGDFFSKLDRQIELEEQKLEKLEEQKKGYMQKLFSQEIRFKDNKGNNYPDWKIVEIGDILEERTERSGEGDMLSVTINNGIIKFDEIDRKDNSSKDKSNYRKVYKDDIAYNSMRMWQGASGKSEYEGIVSPAYTVTIPSENINPDFIAYYFKTHKMIHKFKINSQGLTSDTWNLKYRQLKDIKLNLCSKEEQNKIANLLIMYDKLINKQKHKLEILKTNKKGFLQKMFI
ncbi:restriction endonuclease subunit S [Staphylococcus cohnii]|uniref:restriction endonuclease subunit S n=1 Tax=Staphylococcus cohnii TaxID=29382 RepID=UPI000D1C7255|nr:restriction endonuclease subunit S [Staphylococcus cohnii]PTF31417.1 restriction endonuclease subunit S [Staphylococcus cohnii]